ncbi:calcium-binding protein CP1 [Solanum dulcamara]|uniref:calcium-binding protein CP1 n=1 Tax=Solanum dulcamara TaxID=45834 RepID=UPI0024850B03|nr:calcium-binding protein CP1 [Solanum dulcamara]
MCPTGSVLHSEATGQPNLRSAFDVLDVDRDGKISRDDLRTSYGGFVGEDMIGTMMTVADFNKDGYVEFEEFEKVLDSSRNRNGEEKRKNGTLGGGVNVMEDVFKVIDKDGDGKVGVEDLKSYLNLAGLQVDDDDVKAMIKLGHGDEKGGVTYEGFLQILSL